MRRASVLLLLGLALLLVACAPQPVTRRTIVVPTPSPSSAWNGRTVEDVEKKWGKATEVESDGEGGKVLVFKNDTSFSISSSEGGSAQQPRETPSDTGRTTTEKIQKVVARFWVDAGGTVYRAWFAPEVYNSGREEPPPREAP